MPGFPTHRTDGSPPERVGRQTAHHQGFQSGAKGLRKARTPPAPMTRKEEPGTTKSTQDDDMVRESHSPPSWKVTFRKVERTSFSETRSLNGPQRMLRHPHEPIPQPLGNQGQRNKSPRTKRSRFKRRLSRACEDSVRSPRRFPVSTAEKSGCRVMASNPGQGNLKGVQVHGACTGNHESLRYRRKVQDMEAKEASVARCGRTRNR